MQVSEARKKFLVYYDQWKQSKLNCAEFCKQEGLKYTWFMCHKKIVDKQNRSKGFEQVSISKPVLFQIKNSIEFHYPDGHYFVFGAGTELSLIKELVK